MFGPPAHLYVYLIYGMHHCMNVVTGPVGYGSAVLLRAAELLAPHPNAAERVPVVDRRGAGPALLAKALGVTRQLDGADLLDRSGQIWLEAGRSLDAAQVTVTRRVGVSNGSETPWRWVETGSPFASGGASPLKARGGSRP
jgi:DNA-3-methyladenine glycosylase